MAHVYLLEWLSQLIDTVYFELIYDRRTLLNYDLIMNSNMNAERLSLRKVIEGRRKWRERSNAYQAERRKLQDQTRYLKQSLQEKDDQLIELTEKVNELKNASNS